MQQQVLALLLALQKRYGMSYPFISHDLAVVRTMSHRLIVMKDGGVVEESEAEALISMPGHSYTQQQLAAAQQWRGQGGTDPPNVSRVPGASPLKRDDALGVSGCRVRHHHGGQAIASLDAKNDNHRPGPPASLGGYLGRRGCRGHFTAIAERCGASQFVELRHRRWRGEQARREQQDVPETIAAEVQFGIEGPVEVRRLRNHEAKRQAVVEPLGLHRCDRVWQDSTHFGERHPGFGHAP